MEYVDQAAERLSEKIADAGGGTGLWLADEHPLADSVWQRLAASSTRLITGRYDQFMRAQRAGLTAYFSDFDLREPAQPFGDIYLRVPKERALVHHLLNQAYRALPPGGRLHLAGSKNEGLKTHSRRAQELFGGPLQTEKHGGIRILSLAKTTADNPPLADAQYPQLRPLELAAGEKPYWSKPGIYGWNKIDAGSQLLTDALREHAPEAGCGTRVLDLGCGYGFLTRFAAAQQPAQLVATDSCCAALAATQKNVPTAQVLASDAGDRLTDRFDLILCNPPLHQGFAAAANTGLQRRFLANTRRLLKTPGQAWYVVHQFVPLERLCHALQLDCQPITARAGFKVCALRRSRSR
ncbi:MAG: class I SAM-dependent methyltransferase [Cellvibrionales bacterium]|nr:class I SAM-dependent methyltransferase [Cellvibrionales bacterium]